MKKLVVLLLPLFMFSQKTQNLQMNGSIKDNNNLTKNLIVIDQRPNKDLGTINFKKNNYHFAFPEDNAKAFFEEWYKKSNKSPKGVDNIVLILEDIKFFDQPVEDKSNLKVAIKASTFLEKNGQYYFLKRINNTISAGPDLPNNPLGISLNASSAFQNLIKNSFTKIPSENSISESDLANYENLFTENLEAIKNPLKDGVYSDFESFFSQKPAIGFELIKNKNGEVTKAQKGKETLGFSKIYAYVENGKAFKTTAAGFMPLSKDDKGFYVFTNYGTLVPAQMDSTYGMFGLLGAGIGALEASAKNKKMQKEEKYNIYIDPLSGEFNFAK